jgi:tetratricopeptide (TPR) repeat protein
VGQIYAQAQEAQQRGNYRAAAEKYSAILKLRPDALEVRVNLSLMHHLLAEYPEAIRNFETVLRDKPALFVPNLFLGLDLLQLQQHRLSSMVKGITRAVRKNSSRGWRTLPATILSFLPLVCIVRETIA